MTCLIYNNETTGMLHCSICVKGSVTYNAFKMLETTNTSDIMAERTDQLSGDSSTPMLKKRVSRRKVSPCESYNTRTLKMTQLRKRLFCPPRMELVQQIAVNNRKHISVMSRNDRLFIDFRQNMADGSNSSKGLLMTLSEFKRLKQELDFIFKSIDIAEMSDKEYCGQYHLFKDVFLIIKKLNFTDELSIQLRRFKIDKEKHYIIPTRSGVFLFLNEFYRTVDIIENELKISQLDDIVLCTPHNDENDALECSFCRTELSNYDHEST